VNPKIVNPVFYLVLASEMVLGELLCGSSLVFGVGLFAVIESTASPTIAYFKSLPTSVKKRWAVYLLVLEKLGCRPKIYIGSGTNAVEGATTRFRQYDNLENLPRFVAIALKDGYAITHKGVLCSVELPGPLTRFAVRILFLTLEATFTLVFWAMQSKKDYGLPVICPWLIEALEYDGCCTHLPLGEPVEGSTEGLTDDQILANEAEKYAKHLARGRKYASENPDVIRRKGKRTRANGKASRKHVCEPCGVVCTNKSQLDIHLETQKHKEKVHGVAKKAKALKGKASGKYCCKTCNHYFHSIGAVKRHYGSQKHLDKAASVGDTTKFEDLDFSKPLKHPTAAKRLARNKASGKHACKTCDVPFGQKSALQRHLESKTHRDKVAALEEAIESSS
jgi:hypothetical protein